MKIAFRILPLCCILMLCSASDIHAQEAERVMGLEEIYSLADSSSLTIKTAMQEAKSADANVKVAKNGLLPDINFSASATYNGNAWMSDRDFSNGQSLPSPHFGNNFALEVRQIVYAGGALSHGIRGAELQADIANLNVADKRQNVRFLLTGYYLNLYKFRNLERVYNKNIERAKEVIKDMRAREEQGIVLSNDITRYEVLLQNLLYRRTELVSQIDVFNNQLTTTLDLPGDIQIMPDTTLLRLSMHEYSEDELRNIAYVNSPRLEIARTSIELGRNQEKIARSGLLPKISIIAGDHLNGPITVELPPINKNLNNWYFGVGLAYNIGNIYKSRRDITRSKLNTSASEAKYAEIQENLDLEIHQAYVNYQNAFELLRTQEKSLQLATENYAVTENRYNNDLVLLIDLLDAENIRLDAEVQYVNARINIIYNYYRLMYVTGTL
ncbi:MAG: TolC family protein [Bacteroidales bacterium]|nr:TolC family protein [Bacteroidales bacterium]